jgi:hypothetical protein
MKIKISGQIDLYTDETIYDFKDTSVWTIIFGDRFDEWEQQLNIYAYLLRKNGFPVKGLIAIAFLRDWSYNEAERKADYPQQKIEIVPLELWSEEKQLRFIAEKLELLEKNDRLSDHELTPCTLSEMWSKPDKFAVYKNTNKRATSVCDSMDQANAFIADQKDSDKFRIEYRPGIRTRCEHPEKYCSVAPFCQQFKEYQEAKNER